MNALHVPSEAGGFVPLVIVNLGSFLVLLGKTTTGI